MKRLITYIILALSLSAQIPNGYYDSAAGLDGNFLQQALHDIIDDHIVASYTALWTHYQSTDVHPDSAGMVWDMYSDTPGQTPPYWLTYVVDQDKGSGGTIEGDKYNREHSWPKSWFNEAAPMESDIFHVYPTDKYVNNRRGNYPYGEVPNPTWTSQNGSKVGSCGYPGYTGTAFEPIDAYKGDFARSYFYMSTRYLDEDGTWDSNDMVTGSQLKPWALDMMLEWHAADTVSQKEIDRNNKIYTNIQGNRNPFIDHPSFTDLIWGGSYPVNINYEPSELPRNQNLISSYPNPFNAGTIINFIIRESGQTKIEIFNLEGQLVADLMDRTMGSGQYEIRWSGVDDGGRDLASGVYLLRLSSPQSNAIQRVTLLR